MQQLQSAGTSFTHQHLRSRVHSAAEAQAHLRSNRARAAYRASLKRLTRQPCVPAHEGSLLLVQWRVTEEVATSRTAAHK